ncbi:CDP-diacylglycerol--glycerol-3-phosphate 3-phosphatidyltransferase [Arsenicicoccus dermatophilus]|uniref:CDP-diacylglycerol--glycerol-3-phosphate 3-phosphatidyltransferase n=1 Tax=Arsenicicoccus dermatophilus TaxID=1076331 RepID=UPI00391726F8
MSSRHTPAEQPTRQVSAWNVANALTVLRILLVPVFVWLLMRHHGTDVSDRWWAFAVFLLASLTDKVDGDIARSRGLITDFGKLADPIADKALMGAGLVCLSLLGLLWWWVTVVILVRELGITVMRFVVKRYGVMAASRGGKLKTMLQAIALGMYLVPGPGWWLWLAGAVMAAALAVTVVTGVDYVLAARRLRAEGRRG